MNNQLLEHDTETESWDEAINRLMLKAEITGRKFDHLMGEYLAGFEDEQW